MLGLCRDYGHKMESTMVYWGYVGVLKNETETTICETKPDGLLYRIMKNCTATTDQQSLISHL